MLYLDNAASTAPSPDVVRALAEATAEHFANPSSAHALGAAAARALERARTEVAALVKGEPGEIIFTSGGTEANALAVLGAAGVARGRHVVTSALEHSAVLRSLELLAARGFTITTVTPAPDGRLRVEDVLAAMRADTALVAVMLVNNEIGSLQPVAEIAGALRATGSRAHLHCDAVQAAGLVPVDARALGVDSLALSAHKLHGPKGAGALWLRKGARLGPLWDGGRQERGLRSGTENLPALVAFGVAAAQARPIGPTAARVTELRDRLENQAIAAVPEARRTIPAETPRSPHIASLLIPKLPAEPLLHALEARGIYASAGSACATRTRGPSHVLTAIGVPDDAAVLRFSLARTTADDAPALVASALRAAVDEVAAVVRPAARAR